jgi:hypothetical protein
LGLWVDSHAGLCQLRLPCLEFATRSWLPMRLPPGITAGFAQSSGHQHLAATQESILLQGGAPAKAERKMRKSCEQSGMELGKSTNYCSCRLADSDRICPEFRSDLFSFVSIRQLNKLPVDSGSLIQSQRNLGDFAFLRRTVTHVMQEGAQRLLMTASTHERGKVYHGEFQRANPILARCF